MSKDYRYIRIPKPVQMINRRTGKPLTDDEPHRMAKDKEGNVVIMQRGAIGPPQSKWALYDYLTIFVFQDTAWDKPLKKGMIKRRVLDAVYNQDTNAVVKITEDDWRDVKTYLESEDFTCGEPFGSQLIHLPYTLIDASPTDPDTEAPGEAMVKEAEADDEADDGEEDDDNEEDEA